MAKAQDFFPVLTSIHQPAIDLVQEQGNAHEPTRGSGRMWSRAAWFLGPFLSIAADFSGAARERSNCGDRAIKTVARSIIRTDDDEVTNNLQIMLRFDLELKLLEGKLRV